MKKPIIEFTDFTFKYRSQAQPTLNHINLTIYEGEKVLIVGASGSGKSTIGHCINGLVPFSYRGDITGSLKINGIETRNEGIFTLSKTVGTVLQDPDGQFIGLSVGEDIAFTLENDCISQPDMRARVEDVSKMVDMDDYLSHSLHQLSGGQKQRVALGGVMVDDVDILLFDEPLANLDPATGKHAIELINQIHEEWNKTIVIIEHRLEDVLHCPVDRMIVLRDGVIVADTTPNELLSSNILEECSIHEPLYIRALKLAGCEISPDTDPQHIHRLKLDPYKDKLLQWYNSATKRVQTPVSAPILQLENIDFGYQKEKPILHHISFSIEKGEMVSIVGRNGAGKSTLTKVVCGFEQPTSGGILIEGRDISKDTIKERSLTIGMVMQNPNHMISKHMIYDEVALGLVVRGVPDEEIKPRVEEALKICGLLPYRNWPISALSFGQKKRVTIASILVLKPQVLILDEPTAGQDFRHYTEIMEFLVNLNHLGMTIILITHDMHLMLEYTPRTIVIANGKKIADTVSADILTDEVIIEQANLKETSLFDLAIKAGIENPRDFVHRFISYEREVGHKWQ